MSDSVRVDDDLPILCAPCFLAGHLVQAVAIVGGDTVCDDHLDGHARPRRPPTRRPRGVAAMKQDRAPSPSRTLCSQCLWEIPPPEAMTDLKAAEHRARHLDWLANGDVRRCVDRLDAWRTYATELEKDVAHIRGRYLERIANLEDRVNELEFENHALLTHEIEP